MTYWPYLGICCCWLLGVGLLTCAVVLVRMWSKGPMKRAAEVERSDVTARLTTMTEEEYQRHAKRFRERFPNAAPGTYSTEDLIVLKPEITKG